MKSSNVPGYKDLFGEPRKRYEDLVKSISSELLIRICSALNNELNGTGGLHRTQTSVFKDFTKRFNQEQRADLQRRLDSFRDKVGKDTTIILFGTRYFMTMILKELNNYRAIDDSSNDAMQEYNLFKAYLLVIDEVAEKDHQAIDFKALIPGDQTNLLRLMWLPTISQYEYNEKSSLLFEAYKAMCFFKFIMGSPHRVYLKEFLTALSFTSVGMYLKSFDQINKSIQSVDHDAPMLKRLNYIVPGPGVDHAHLKRLSVNLQEKDEFLLADIKKAPLCFAADRSGYIVIDYNYSTKKMFRGAFFEICHTTSLTQGHSYTDKKKSTLFNKYSTQVSEAFEKNYFKPIMQLFSQTGSDFTYFDDGTPNIPDCYIRLGNKVILFEYKAYVFQEDLIINPDFDKLTVYLDKKFVLSDQGRPKGVGQLANQIDLIIKRSFTFDPELYQLHDKGDLVIFPVIIYNDFNFSLPGINGYLNGKMLGALAGLQGERIAVAPLVMLNLETIMDLAITGKNMTHLGSGFLNYYDFLEQSHQLLIAEPTQTNFLRANSSFDEFYNTYLIERTKSKDLVPAKMRELLTLSEIVIEEFNNPI